jgi:hypothetical protein
MIDKATHPFIVNTLESSLNWEVSLRKFPGGLWESCLYHGQDFLTRTIARGNTLPDALDRLEAELAGRESA